jgi:hypothetical protein
MIAMLSERPELAVGALDEDHVIIRPAAGDLAPPREDGGELVAERHHAGALVLILVVVLPVFEHLSLLIDKGDIKTVLSQWAAKPLGFYRWEAIRYFMFEYEQALRRASKDGREKLHWKEFVGERRGPGYATIEHVYPRKAQHAYWRSRFQKYSSKERNVLKNSLGNLLPLSRGKNSSLGNKTFPEKKGSADSAVGYAYGCYSENEIALLPEWNAKEILERGSKLLDFFEERWGITLGNRQDKIRMLRLGFV